MQACHRLCVLGVPELVVLSDSESATEATTSPKAVTQAATNPESPNSGAVRTDTLETDTESTSYPSSEILYDELRDLPFPPCNIPSQKLVQLMSIPSVNNTRPLVQLRKGQSDCKLNVQKCAKQYSKWLVIGNDGALCKACKLFISVADIPKVYGKFLSKPWRGYSRTQDLKDHEQTTYHQNAEERFYNRVSVATGRQQPVTSLLNKEAAKKLTNRKKRLDSIIRSLVFCARQGIALRGHRNESSPLLDSNEYHDGVVLGDVNRGNLLQLLEFRRQSGDENIDLFINKKSLYTSPEIQNQLLKMTADQVIGKVVDDVKRSPYYSIISDETRDTSNTEQLCIALRYYNVNLGKTDETFLCFLGLESLKGMHHNFHLFVCQTISCAMEKIVFVKI